MSIASTLVPTTSTSRPEQTRTTLTGRPLEYKHDSLSNASESPLVGANTLPPGYTDNSLVHIPIKTALYLDPKTHTQPQNVENDVKRSPPRKGSVLSRLSSKFHDGVASNNKDSDDMKIVAMSRGDYLKYWVKGEDGEFKDSVVEPPEGRAEWLANALERQEREGLGRPTPPQIAKGIEVRATVIGAVGAMMGSSVSR